MSWEMTAEQRAERAAYDERRKAEYKQAWADARKSAGDLGRDYVVCASVGVKQHAAVTTIVANGGFTFPRPMCAVSASSTRAYASVIPDQSIEVTCKRCIASLEKRAARLAQARGVG